MDKHPPTVPRRDFLAGVVGLTSLGSRFLAPAADAEAAQAIAPPTFMYVGCYTTTDRGHGEGISVYRRDPGSKQWTLVHVLKGEMNPSFLAMSRDGRFLYSVHGGDGTYASAYQIDEVTGRLTKLNQQPVKGSNPVHLAIDATNRFLVVANYATSGLAVLPIDTNGALGPLTDLLQLSGTPGPYKRQIGAHPHACPFDRTGRYVVVPDLGVDAIFVVRLDTASGKLMAGDMLSVSARAGAGPRHVDFHPTRPYAYVINELDSTVTTYDFNPDQRTLKPRQIVTTLPTNFTGSSTTAEIAIAPSGRFLYGSNRGHDSIAIFAISPANGELTPVGWEPTRGMTPRFFGLDPTGTHLYAANQRTDTIVIFRVDEKTGRLTATGEVLETPSPCTIVFR